MKLLSFGEVLFDVYPDACYIGGAPLNFAAHANALGADSYVLSAVGYDDLGDKAISIIKNLGVDPRYVAKLKDSETGRCIVTLNENHIPSYNLLSDVAYDYIPCPDFNEKDRFEVLAFGTLALRSEYNLETVKKIIGKNICREIYSDLNIRPPHYSRESILFCLENATIVKISDEELGVVTQNALGLSVDINSAPGLLKEKFPQLKLIIITCGGNGSLVYDCITSTTHTCDAVKTNVVSTVGAGDSFGAAFLAELLNGSGIQSSLEFASKISSYVCSKEGAIPDDMREYILKIRNNG